MSNAPQDERQFSQEVLTKAAAWAMRHHDPKGPPPDDEGLQHWLSESPVNRKAFELAKRSFAALREQNMRDVERYQAKRARRRERASQIVKSLAAATIAVVVVLLFFGMLADRAVTTRPIYSAEFGDHQRVRLPDGTFVTLNKAAISVNFDQRARRVRLKSGEALFEVADDDNRPFIVAVENREIRAVGTRFLANRNSASRFSVTLVEGVVTVVRTSTGWRRLLDQVGLEQSHILNQPRQRLTFSGDDSSPEEDYPQLHQLVAWRMVDFSGWTIADAVTEMNRYSEVKLHVVEADTAHMNLWGPFRSGDVESFADAVAKSFGLKVRKDDNMILILGHPSINAKTAR